MLDFFRKIIARIEDYPLSFTTWLASFTALILLRLWTESWLINFRVAEPLFLFYEFTHTFSFFLFAYLLAVWLVNRIAKIELVKVANVLLWGYFLIITPPIVDYLASGGRGLWSFYKFDGIIGLGWRFLTFFGDRPDIGITYGTRLEVFLAVVFLAIYTFLKKKKVSQILSLIIAVYAIFFVLGTFPSWITIIVRGFQEGFLNISDVSVAKMFLSPVKIFTHEVNDLRSALNIKMSLVYALMISASLLFGFFLQQKEKILVFIRNARCPQLIYHAGLLIVGMGIGAASTNTHVFVNFFNLLSLAIAIEAVFAAWIASVIINDFVDLKIDEKSNAWRPLPSKIFNATEYKILGYVFFVSSLILAAMINAKMALFLLIYQVLAWVYSVWPFRLKRFALISTIISALASIMVLFSGFILINPEQTMDAFPKSIIWLLLIAYTFSLPLKDFKDLEADKQDGVYTIPVILGEDWGKIAVGSGIFISLVLSVILLNEFKLFWWATIFGSAAFLIVNQMKEPDQKSLIHYQNIFWWILGVIFLYGIIATKIIFF